MKKTPQINIEKIKERTSRMSLTLALSIFVFIILLAAIGLTALGLWLLAKAGVIVDINGELQLGQVILFMSLISLIIGGVSVFFSSRLPLKPVNEIINKMNRFMTIPPGIYFYRISISWNCIFVKCKQKRMPYRQQDILRKCISYL